MCIFFLLFLNYVCVNSCAILFQFSSWVGKKKKKLLKLFNGFPLNRQVLQLPISVSSHIPGSSCFVLRLHRALKQLERRSRARKRNAGRHTFLNVPCIHTHPASFACRCAHTHTQRNHTSHLYFPCAAVDRVPLQLPPSLPAAAAAVAAAVAVLFSPRLPTVLAA